MLKKILRKTGTILLNLSEGQATNSSIQPDMIEPEFHDIYAKCKEYTMTSAARMYGLFKAVEYVINAKIPGDFVECGVWRGGSSMLIAYMLANRKITDRKIYLYDTFEGMSAPSKEDVDITGKNADNLLDEGKNQKETSVWCLADLSDVQNNLALTGIHPQQVIYIKGKVEETIPGESPRATLALLRLDTDWYESTRHELVHLYPQLSAAGVLIIDDYGHWTGCRKAVDEYFAAGKQKPIYLSRVDYTGRIGIKSF
ncbi:MAG: TylF/MycF/NovP-related O-methyltransferase [Turneriella sp.]